MPDIFPSSKLEALTYLYLQNQDLSDKSPEELYVMYLDVYKKIHTKYDEIRKSDRRDSLI